MKVNIASNNLRAYDVNEVDVIEGQEYSIDTDSTTHVQWFSDNDMLADFEVGGGSAVMTAKKEGRVTILIMDGSYAILKTIRVNIRKDAILPSAATIGVVVGDAVPK